MYKFQKPKNYSKIPCRNKIYFFLITPTYKNKLSPVKALMSSVFEIKNKLYSYINIYFISIISISELRINGGETTFHIIEITALISSQDRYLNYK